MSWVIYALFYFSSTGFWVYTLTGKGLQADRTGTANTMSVYVSSDTTNGHGMINPYAYMSPPFVGTWANPVGMGVKKKGDKGCCLAKTVHSIQFQF